MATLIRYKATGHKRLVADFAARNLVNRGIVTLVADESTPAGEYQTRALSSSPLVPAVVKSVEQASSAPDEPPSEQHTDPATEQTDAAPPVAASLPDIDALDHDALRALADERGLKYHHRAGADKLRALLRGEG